MNEALSDIQVYELPTGEAMRMAATRSYLAQRRALPRREIGAGILAASVSLLLHALFVGSLWRDGSHRIRVPDVQDVSASAVTSAQEPAMTLIFFSTPDAKQTDDTAETLASRGMEAMNSQVIVISPDSLPAVGVKLPDEPADNATAPPEAAADQAARALLYGRYLGQIAARVKRAWLRPRTPIGAPSFACRVQVVQDRDGTVRETTLQRCNGDVRWQQSLVDAIQNASPLPEPPNPSVFANAVTLQFDAEGWQEGRGDEGFEPASRVAPLELQPFPASVEKSSGTPTRSIDLHIVGPEVGAAGFGPAH